MKKLFNNILAKSLCLSFAVLVTFSMLFTQVFAATPDDVERRAPSITTQEKITHKVVTEGPLNVSYIYFRSRADIQDVTGILMNVHSARIYSVGSITLTNIHETYPTKNTAFGDCDYAMSPYHTGYWSSTHTW